jgi:hypothetical protein
MMRLAIRFDTSTSRVLVSLIRFSGTSTRNQGPMKVPSSVPLKTTRALSRTVPRSSRQLVAPSGVTGRGKEIE